jgi:HK97 family phage major capsid protein
MQYRREDGQVIRMDAQTVDDDSRGGYLVPAPLAAAILAVRDRFGVARRVSRIIPMASETLSIPKRAGGLTVYSPAEGAAITTSEATWSQVSLSTTDRFTLTRVSRKLLRSALVSVADQVAMEIGQAFGEGLDNEWCNGDGTGTYLGETGVRSAVGAAGVNTMATTSGDTWAETALADFTNTAALLPERFHNENTSWVCSRAYYTSVIERLMIAAGGTTTANIAAGGTPSLLGYPIYFSEKMPTSTAVSTIQAVLGDFYNGVIIGERQGIEIGMSEHRYFDSDEIGIRGKISYDLNVHGGGDGSNAEAYVALKTGAAS